MTSSSQRQYLNIGPWKLNLARDMVTGPDGASGLNPRAESLLLLLCRNANLLVTREQILDEVWAGRVVEDAAISNAVWQIRKALGDDGKAMLQTRLKRGYVLVVPESAWQSEAPALSDAMDHPFVALPQDQSVVGPSAQENHAPPRSSSSVPTPDRSPADRPLRMNPLRAVFRARYRWAMALLLSVCAVSAWFGLRQNGHDAPGRILLSPDVEMTAFISAPGDLAELYDPVLRALVEQTYLRDTSLLLFEKTQRRNPFAGPHVQIELRRQSVGTVSAEMSIAQGKTVEKYAFRGPSNQLVAAVNAWLVRVLSPATRAPTPGGDAFISGLMAENRFDSQAAIIEYRKSIARDPRMIDAKIALARLYLQQGRWRTALAFIDEVDRDAKLQASQRCELNMVLARAAPELVRPPLCARVENDIKLGRMQFRDLLRKVESDRNPPQGPTDWAWQRAHVLGALIELREWSRATAEIQSMEKIAEDAGWEWKRADLIGWRALLNSYRGDWSEEAKLRRMEADRLEALGDIDDASSRRIMAIQALPVVPGDGVKQDRKTLHAIIDRSRETGSVYNELIALQALVRIDADDSVIWQSEMRRMQTLVNENYTSISAATHRYFMLDQILKQGRYGEVIKGATALAQDSKGESEATLWELLLLVEAHFARDELDAAVAVIDGMEKKDLDFDSSGDICLYSRLFAEAGKFDRARVFLKQCLDKRYERGEQAYRGDQGLFARARLFQLEGQVERAWPTLQPRIDALLATPDLSAQEATSLAFLARHATTMPGADRNRLERALQVTSSIAARDGAGPQLRFGVHVLRWRLCHTQGRTDCGSVLPPWASEDRWEARMAEDSKTVLVDDRKF